MALFHSQTRRHMINSNNYPPVWELSHVQKDKPLIPHVMSHEFEQLDSPEIQLTGTYKCMSLDGGISLYD